MDVGSAGQTGARPVTVDGSGIDTKVNMKKKVLIKAELVFSGRFRDAGPAFLFSAMRESAVILCGEATKQRRSSERQSTPQREARRERRKALDASASQQRGAHRSSA